MDKKKNGTANFNEQDEDLSSRIIMDSHAALSVLTFPAGILNLDMPNCIKRPGIYGSIFQPIELLDSLIVENGINKNSVRFAGQFRYSQYDISEHIKKGNRIEMNEDLTIIIRRSK